MTPVGAKLTSLWCEGLKVFGVWDGGQCCLSPYGLSSAGQAVKAVAVWCRTIAMKYLQGMSHGLPVLLVCATAVVGSALLPSVAEARVVVDIGVPLGWYGPPYYYGPPAYPYPPAYAYPPPYVAPSPVYVAPPVQYLPPPEDRGPAAAPSWYYCNSPKGYYPYVRACPGGWRQVQPTPTQ